MPGICILVCVNAPVYVGVYVLFHVHVHEHVHLQLHKLMFMFITDVQDNDFVLHVFMFMLIFF